MSENWKPGDVAMVCRNGKWAVSMRYDTGAERAWRYQPAVGQAFDHFEPDSGTSPRRLVVIDPEDREQTDALVDALVAQADVHFPNRVQAALREFANPTPEVAEPTAHYAVVRDSNGDEWCHIGAQVWRSLSSSGAYMVEKHWHDADSPLAGNAVEILSEGVVTE